MITPTALSPRQGTMLHASLAGTARCWSGSQRGVPRPSTQALLHSRVDEASLLAQSASCTPDSRLMTFRCSASASRGSEQLAPAVASWDPTDAFQEGRAEYLQTLLRLRRFYRNCVRAEVIDRSEDPAFVPLTEAELSAEFVTDEDREEAKEQRQEEAITSLASMQATIYLLQYDCGFVVEKASKLDLFATDAEQVEKGLDALCDRLCGKVEARIQKELKDFLRKSDASLTERSVRQRIASEVMTLNSVLSFKKAGVRMANSSNIFSSQIRPAVRKATDAFAERGISEAFKASRTYISDFWARLNGQRTGNGPLPLGLELPNSQADAIWASIERAQMKIPQLEKELVDSSKAREQRVRRAPIERRGVLAFEMQELDAKVLQCGRELAMLTLDIQLDYLYLTLEDEARQVFDAPAPPNLDKADASELHKLAPRRGSTEELNLLIAQFGILCSRHQALADVLQRQQTSSGLLPAFDEELRRLAEEITETRLRLGIPDQAVFGGSGVSLRKIQLQAKDTLATVRDGIDFFTLGLRMLGSDVGYAGSLFGRASLGNTLKPREVSALRRTLKDILTFVPFIIILIIPLTPVGHVLVFGFIQRYFPDFFPSQFNTTRQEMVKRYEQLRQELFEAQAAANLAQDEMEFKNAKAAIARLTPPSMPVLTASASSASSPRATHNLSAENSLGDAAEAKLQDLTKKVEAAQEDALTFESGSDSDIATR